MSTCVVYDDRRGARERLHRMFAAVPGVRQVIRVASPDELIVRVTGEPGQVAVVGTQRAVSSGIHVIRRVVAVRPGAVVVAVGARDDAPSADAAAAAGARGFVGWDASPAVTQSLVRAAVSSSRTVEPSVARGAAGARPPRDDGYTVCRRTQGRLGITEREMEVLGGISRGLSVVEISRDLGLSENTVKSLVRRVFAKLGVHERAHAVGRAYRSGLFACTDTVPDIRATSFAT